ncbi:MAG: hypothetical protein ASARMPREDX12_007234 [Alectoria sarmentosa]|nr:MAG: hypothetical protein ASARMPREDX12_007234 [Alectoria sarmentosa]
MAESKQDSLTDMVSMMKDITIKDDVHDILGAHGQGLRTWGDVDIFMKVNAKSLGPGIVDGVKEKLCSEVKDKKQVQELMRALQEAQIDSIPKAKHKGVLLLTPSLFFRTGKAKHEGSLQNEGAGQGHDRYRWHEDRAEKAEEKGVVCSEDVVNPVSEAAKKGRGSILLISKVSTAHNWDGKKQIILNSMTGTKQSMFLLPVCQNPKKDE